MTAIQDVCHDILEKTWEIMKNYVDRHKTELLKYSKGDLVMLGRKNI
jgi:hypothetical protein